MLARLGMRHTRPAFSRYCRRYSQETPNRTTKSSWLFIDSVFPLTFFRLDPRYIISSLQQDDVLARLHRILDSVHTNDFHLLSIQPRAKDGGLFVHFSYTADESDPQSQAKPPDPIPQIIQSVHEQADRLGGLPSWFSAIKKPQLWPVKGEPWMEDMNRFVSPKLKVEFEGPDVHIEDLWEIFRPYGKILEITSPTPVPAGSLRFSTIIFANVYSAAIARNCVHGDRVTGLDGKLTRISTTFEAPLKAHVIRDWITGHPRIIIPVVVFLLGTLTYTIFDPIRAFAVQAKMEQYFDWKEYRIVKWLRRNTLDRLSLRHEPEVLTEGPGIWKERREAEQAIEIYLHDMPETVSFVHGPQGSGKTETLKRIVEKAERRVLLIDCNLLYKGGSEAGVLTSLASQTGYWPLFTFLNQVNGLLDLASTGLIGKPTGLSTSFDTQVTQILDVVSDALDRVQSSYRHSVKVEQKHRIDAIQEKDRRARVSARIKKGTWHDGRIDCIAGNGVMSELGVGDENLDDRIVPTTNDTPLELEDRSSDGLPGARVLQSDQIQTSVSALPVVIIKNFANRNAANKEELLNALATWVAGLARNKTAHVFVVSDNRENARRVAQALPSSPLVHVPFSDADTTSALSFVASKLSHTDAHQAFSKKEIELIERLGGRTSDLETMIHKVRNGETITFAVEDIINRGVSELRKTAFGDDIEDSKSLSWSREQAWTVVKLLATNPEIPYYDTLLKFPFKSNEAALRAMEQAELIAITIHDGRPAYIKPGKPVFKWVFERLVNDSVFHSLQEINIKEKLLASAEAVIQSCEKELLVLKEMNGFRSSWNPLGSTAVSGRVEYLLAQMEAAERKRLTLEAEIGKLQRKLHG